MNDKIKEMAKRTYRYYYEDGLAEMGVGLLFVLVGLALVGWQQAQETPWVGLAAAIGLPLLTIGGAFLMRMVVQTLKERVTYPRTGYVSYRRGERTAGRWLVIAAALTVAVVSVLLPESFSRMHFMVGSLLAIVLAHLGYRLGLRRFYVEAAVAWLLGLVTAGLFADEMMGTGIVFSGAGLATVAAGLATLSGYLRRHPRPVAE